jgi:1,4-dihydroxy-2-naphthoyl-CoA hydrolase
VAPEAESPEEARNRELPPDGPDAMVGLELGEASDSEVTASFPAAPPNLQPFGIVHGGIYSLVAESICSYATHLAVAERGDVAMGMANQATFLRPVTQGTVHVRATRRHGGRTTWVWDVEFTDHGGRTCALVRMTIAVRPAPSG